MNKGQSQMVSAVIVILIAISIVGTVFPWANSVIQKKRDSKTVDDTYNFFQQLEEKITNIARNGGEESLELKVPGIIKVYPESISDPLNNSIVFQFESKVSNVAESQSWIPLNTPNANLTATLGIDKAGVVFGKANIGDDRINVFYRVWFRELEDKSTGKKYKIAIKTDGEIKQTTNGFLRIQRADSTQIGNLIKTQINIIV